MIPKRLQRRLTLAKKLAEDFTIQHTGITKNYFVVTTKPCVDWQRKKGNLLYHVDGKWSIERTKDSAGWVKGDTVVYNSNGTKTSL